MAKDIYDIQVQCLELAMGMAADAQDLYSEVGAATIKQGTVDAWTRIKADLENAKDGLNDLLNNLQTITGGA